MDIQGIIIWMESLAIQYSYPGIFLISLVGSLSVLVPLPAPVVIFALGGSSLFDPLLVAITAGLGATVGEYSAYMLGYGGHRFIIKRYSRKITLLTRLFKRYGLIVIFIFTLTPLPSDLLFIPLGVMRYSVLRIFIPAFVGKFLSNLVIVYSGYLSIGIIKDLFGLEGQGVGFILAIIIAIILLILILLVMFKVNWERVVERHLERQ